MDADIYLLTSEVIRKIKLKIGNNISFLEKINQSAESSEQLKLLLMFFLSYFSYDEKSPNSDVLCSLIQKIKTIVDTCPSNQSAFTKWLPKFIVAQNKTINSVQKRVTKLQNHVKELIQQISEMKTSFEDQSFGMKSSTEESSNEESIKSVENKYITIIYNLRKQIDEIKTQLEQRDKEEEKIRNLENEEENEYCSKLNNKIESLKQKLKNERNKNENNQNQITDLKEQIKSLSNESSKPIQCNECLNLQSRLSDLKTRSKEANKKSEEIISLLENRISNLTLENESIQTFKENMLKLNQKIEVIKIKNKKIKDKLLLKIKESDEKDEKILKFKKISTDSNSSEVKYKEEIEGLRKKLESTNELIVKITQIESKNKELLKKNKELEKEIIQQKQKVKDNIFDRELVQNQLYSFEKINDNDEKDSFFDEKLIKKITKMQNKLRTARYENKTLKSKNRALRKENEEIRANSNSLPLSSSSSIYETIGKLTAENEELKKNVFNLLNNKNSRNPNYFDCKEKNTSNDNNNKNKKEESTINDGEIRFSSKEKSDHQTSESSLNYTTNNDSTILSPLNTSSNSTFVSSSFDSPPSSVSYFTCDELNKYREKFQSLKTVISEKDKIINCLKKKLIAVETEKIKLNELLNHQVSKKGDESGMNLKKIGFLLADALCQHFNPSRANDEIVRLIEVARDNHIKLSESVRVPLDPFGAFEKNKNCPDCQMMTSYNTKENECSLLFSRFDELDNQITTLRRFSYV